MLRWLLVLLPLVLVLCLSQAGFAREIAQHPLTITTHAGKVLMFQVELAQTPEEQQRGLMFRTSVPEGTGMLFSFEPPQDVAFWMKNTLIPLDMLFIAKGGVIVNIAANTTPESTALVPSNHPVIAVLEIGGDEAERLGIAVGDKVEW